MRPQINVYMQNKQFPLLWFALESAFVDLGKDSWFQIFINSTREKNFIISNNLRSRAILRANKIIYMRNILKRVET